MFEAVLPYNLVAGVADHSLRRPTASPGNR